MTKEISRIDTLKDEKELTLRQKKTSEILDKMHVAVDAEKFNHLADRVSDLSFEMLDVGEKLVKQISRKDSPNEEDEYRLGRISRVLESCAKALDSVNNFRNKRFMEMEGIIKAETSLENSKKEINNTSLVFQFQGNGNKSISPVLEMLGEIIPNPPKEEIKALPPKLEKPKENPLDVSGKSYKASSNAKKHKIKKGLCYIFIGDSFSSS